MYMSNKIVWYFYFIYKTLLNLTGEPWQHKLFLDFDSLCIYLFK